MPLSSAERQRLFRQKKLEKERELKSAGFRQCKIWLSPEITEKLSYLQSSYDSDDELISQAIKLLYEVKTKEGSLSTVRNVEPNLDVDSSGLGHRNSSK